MNENLDAPTNQLSPNFDPAEFASFQLSTILVESVHLKNNPWKDSPRRRNPVFIPKGLPPAGGWPVVLSLSGFTGNGTFIFNMKANEINQPQTLDRAVSAKLAPQAIYVFCDAMTFWGGSQFVDSLGMGNYESYIVKELVPAIRELLPASKEAKWWCITGGSSGGYGALHLGSRYPEIFGIVAAIAPDCFFEASLLAGIYKAMPTLSVCGFDGVRAEVESGKLFRNKDAHAILDAVAMGLCYAPILREGDQTPAVEWPVDARTGILNAEVWKRWKAHDPLEFLKARAANLRQVHKFYLDVGTRDQFQLQFGTRQIFDLLSAHGAKVVMKEFDGTHFDIGERRPEFWKWLLAEWA